MQEAFRIVSDCLCVIYASLDDGCQLANAAFHHSFIVVVDPMVAIVNTCKRY